MGDGLSYDALVDYNAGLMRLLHLASGKSVYEVGCGAGVNLYLMQREGVRVGGSDYAESLVETARRAVSLARELATAEAADLPTEETYDAVFSCGVFHYFTDYAYATRVLERMLAKTSRAIGVFDVHDSAREKAYLAFRRSNIPNFDERYAGLPHLFYPQSFFEAFAREHRLEITFPALELAGYWNTPFVYNVLMYRK